MFLTHEGSKMMCMRCGFYYLEFSGAEGLPSVDVDCHLEAGYYFLNLRSTGFLLGRSYCICWAEESKIMAFLLCL